MEQKAIKKKRAKKGEGHIFKKGNTYYLQYNVNKKRKIISLKCTVEREAKQKAAEILTPLQSANTKQKLADFKEEALNLVRGNNVKLEKVWALYLKSNKRPDSSEGTLKNYKRMWKKFFSWLEKHYPGIDTLAQVTEEMALEYSEELWDEKISANTFNYHIQALKLVTKVLARQAGILIIPFDVIVKKAENRQSRKEFTEKEVLKILNSFTGNKKLQTITHKDELEVLFYIGAWTALRLIDCVNIKWSNVDLKRNLISCKPQKTARKTNKIITIPIHPALSEQLQKAKEWKANSFILPKISARYAKNPNGLQKDIGTVLTVNGFDTTQEIKGVQRKRKANIYGFHSFRHSFVSFCAKKGVPLAVVQSIVGHSNPAITRHYIHMGEDSAQQAIDALPTMIPTKQLPNRLEELKMQINDLVEKATEEQAEDILSYSKEKIV